MQANAYASILSVLNYKSIALFHSLKIKFVQYYFLLLFSWHKTAQLSICNVPRMTQVEATAEQEERERHLIDKALHGSKPCMHAHVGKHIHTYMMPSSVHTHTTEKVRCLYF